MEEPTAKLEQGFRDDAQEIRSRLTQYARPEPQGEPTPKLYPIIGSLHIFAVSEACAPVITFADLAIGEHFTIHLSPAEYMKRSEFSASLVRANGDPRAFQYTGLDSQHQVHRLTSQRS